MYSLFRLLFQSAYWRKLMRGLTWQEAARNFKRAHKDKRARRQLYALTFLLIVPILCIGYLIVLFRTGALILAPFVFAVLWWRNRKEKQDSVTLRITPSFEPIQQGLSEEQHQSLRLYLADLTFYYAVMVHRAGSESFLKNKTLPEGAEVISRQMHLQLLRSRGLWDKMTRRDRERMMMPDGHWDWPEINQAAAAIEPLRLLRWVLRIDFYLPVIGQQLQINYGLANELIKDPKKVLEGKAIVEISTARVGKDSAEQFFARCWAECVSRGYYECDEQVTQWATTLSASLNGKQHEDFVLGNELVSEVEKDNLLWATMLSQRRLQFLTWIMPILETGAPSEAQTSVFEEELAVESAPNGV
jgi:hypothetical protein